MKKLKSLVAVVLLGALCASPMAGLAADQNTNTNAVSKPKPYPLKTCVVSGDKLGEMGNPYVFVYKGREIKLCCKGCLKDFKKDPAKYVKQLDAADAKAKTNSATADSEKH